VPLALLSQIYTIVLDRSDVDRTIDDLRGKGIVRCISLPSHCSDTAVVLTRDITDFIETLAISKEHKRQKVHVEGESEKGVDEGLTAIKTNEGNMQQAILDAAILRNYKQFIATNKGSTFSYERIHALTLSPVESKAGGEGDTGTKGAVRRSAHLGYQAAANNASKAEKFNVLFHEGLLVNSEGGYALTLPGISKFNKMLIEGRKELCSILKSQKFKQLLEKVVLTKKIRSSELGLEFHIRDLIGSGVISRLPSPAGDVLRLNVLAKK
jgi:hypothetical protein